MFSITTLEKVPALDTLLNDYLPPVAKSLLSGILPSLVVMIFFSILEPLLIVLVSFAGMSSFLCVLILSGLTSKITERRRLLICVQSVNNFSVLNLWFTFLVSNVLLFSTIAATFLGAVDQLFEAVTSPIDALRLLAQALPSQATYFMNYVSVSAFPIAY